MERELRRRGVTRALLWQGREDHRGRHPDGFGYSWFCEAYDGWKGRLSPTMRQSHVAGEKVFVDFAGDTIGVVDPRSGEVWQARLFVATMGASNFIFAEARASEGLADGSGACEPVATYALHAADEAAADAAASDGAVEQSDASEYDDVVDDLVESDNSRTLTTNPMIAMLPMPHATLRQMN